MSVELNRRLTLEHAVRVADGAGGYVEAWTPLGELWARVKAGSGRERFGAGVTVSAVPYRIVVRGAPMGAQARPKPEQRFREGTRVFRIVGVAEYDVDARYLTCFAIEEVTG
ncbi:phage head closure protein [Litoreibacter albidus]|uniref:Phage head-tail adaptor, putative, SPP1 family n=1 Tax=Litoreibacter albidus TaxID=670155 RepID=A0A1H2SPH6_9RHOB|nr:phage head closure protein [Litoreibacter albidus]SDW33365.1 phage head-tail adaptor, putative, SPP1 family [Litoreibacter albidus]